ncbi:MAG: PDZ domain-containing protein [Planctomycetota bacterium]|nr:MAG: PDZ domain-containing protein [Planctomycetota bacterium]
MKKTRFVPMQKKNSFWACLFLGFFLLSPLAAYGQNKPTPTSTKLPKKRLDEIQEKLYKVIQKVRPTVAVIRVEKRRGGFGSKRVFGGGSGVMIDPNGYILTNDHVVSGAINVWVGLPGKPLMKAKVVGTDPLGDLAVVKIPGKNYPTAEFGDSENLKMGQWVLAMGNPFSLAEGNYPTVTLGIISGLNRVQGGIKLYGDAIQTDAAINPGNSGGPLFDMDGKLIGINGRISIRAGQRVNVGVGYAIPIHQAKNFLPYLKRGEKVYHGLLGVRFSRELKGATKGVQIDEVIPGSAAEKAGLKAGDIILQFQGKEINSSTRLQNLVTVLPAGTEVTFTILRQGKKMKLKVKLGKRIR